MNPPTSPFKAISVASSDVIDIDGGIATIEAFLAPVPHPEWIRLFGHLRNVIDRTGGRLFTSTEPAALASEVSWRVEAIDAEAAKDYIAARVALTNLEFAVKFGLDLA
jgi:hypothetical protein